MAIFRKSGKYERYEAKKAPTFGGSNGAFLPFRFCGSPSSIRPVTPNRAVTAARNLARLEHVQARRLLRERFWERVWTGPGAVATYLSLPLSLVSVVLADRLQPQLEGPSLWILATDIVVGIGLMLVEVERLLGSLRARLECLPEYDPEGWGLLLSGGQRPGITKV